MTGPQSDPRGQIMSATAFLKSLPRGKQPTTAEIDSAMSGNICRCGTYEQMRDAIYALCNQKRGG